MTRTFRPRRFTLVAGRRSSLRTGRRRLRAWRHRGVAERSIPGSAGTPRSVKRRSNPAGVAAGRIRAFRDVTRCACGTPCGSASVSRELRWRISLPTQNVTCPSRRTTCSCSQWWACRGGRMAFATRRTPPYADAFRRCPEPERAPQRGRRRTRQRTTQHASVPRGRTRCLVVRVIRADQRNGHRVPLDGKIATVAL